MSIKSHSTKPTELCKREKVRLLLEELAVVLPEPVMPSKFTSLIFLTIDPNSKSSADPRMTSDKKDQRVEPGSSKKQMEF